MALNIAWSEEAKESLNDLYDFLETKWTDQVIREFTEKLNKKLELISQTPAVYKPSFRLEGTQECIVTKHNAIFYTYSEEENQLYIVSFLTRIRTI